MGNQMTAPSSSEDSHEGRIILIEGFTNCHLTNKIALAAESYQKHYIQHFQY